MQEAYVYGYWDAFTGFIRGRSQIIWKRRACFPICLKDGSEFAFEGKKVLIG